MPPATRRTLGVAMIVIALARFMVVLDGTIVIVALPSIERSLQMSTPDLNWVINAYALTFGGLMLVAGRIGDVLGRKRVFGAGLVLFGLSSLLGGIAPNGTALIFFRAVQGIGAAISTPGALSLLVRTFPEGEHRTKALGIYGAATGMASVLGLLLGGVLTTYASWRWVFFLNVPVTAGILFGVGALTEGELERVKIDVPGAIVATLGIGSLVFAADRVVDHGWGDPVVIGALALAVAMLATFVIVERASPAPMVPHGVLDDRGRVVANIVTFAIYGSQVATFYFLTLYLQHVRGYSALRTGLMFLPLAVGFGIAAGGASQLLGRTSERFALSSGLVLAAAGTGWLSFITAQTDVYAVLVPAALVTGLGLGITAVAATTIGVRGIDSSEAGIGSSLLTAAGQVGGALGLAVLATVAASTTTHAALGTPVNEALTSGYATGFIVAAAIYVAAVIITLSTIRPMGAEPR